jgi:hypothetical protein
MLVSGPIPAGYANSSRGSHTNRLDSQDDEFSLSAYEMDAICISHFSVDEADGLDRFLYEVDTYLETAEVWTSLTECPCIACPTAVTDVVLPADPG